MVKIYSLRLSAEQNAAFERFEALTSCEPFGIHEFERGEMSARTVEKEHRMDCWGCERRSADPVPWRHNEQRS